MKYFENNEKGLEFYTGNPGQQINAAKDQDKD